MSRFRLDLAFMIPTKGILRRINVIMQDPFSATSTVDHIEAKFAELARDVNVTSQATRNSWLFYIAI